MNIIIDSCSLDKEELKIGFEGLLDYISSKLNTKYLTKHDVISSKDFFDTNDTYENFITLVKCAELNAIGVSYKLEDIDDDIPDDFTFDKVFNCLHSDMQDLILFCIKNILDLEFEKDDNIEIVLNLFIDSITWDLGFLEQCNAEHKLKESDISIDELKNLLPDNIQKSFDSVICGLKNSYDDIDDSEFKKILIDELGYEYNLDWVNIYETYKGDM